MIGEFSEKSPITNINSSSINRLVWYMQTNFDGYGLSSLGDIAVYIMADGWNIAGIGENN